MVLGLSAGFVVAAVGAGGAAREVDEQVEIVSRRVVLPPVFRPAKLSIPSIGLQSAPVIKVWTRADGSMDTPKTAEDVAWHELVKPGAGNALFAAHHDWNGKEGSFYHLDKLKEGDEVYVFGEDKSLTFEITWIKEYDADVDATDILGDDGKPIVTLITCSGYFDPRTRHHVNRLVARGVLSA